jgi:hypothetical protein
MNVKRIFLAAIIVVALALPSVASAWDCKGYNFNVTGGGSVRVENTSNSNEPSQTADVFVNGSKVINNASVPSMPAGTGWTEFATVTVPSGDWSWRVVGSSDCSDEGSYRGEVTATPTPTFEQPTSTHTPKPTKTPTNVPPTETETPVPPTDTPEPTNTPTEVEPTPTGTFEPTPTDVPPTPTPTEVDPTSTPTEVEPTPTPTEVEPTPTPTPTKTVPQELPKVGLSYADWAPGVWGMDGYDNVLLTHNGRPTSIGSDIVWLEEGDVFTYQEVDYVVAKYMEVAPEDVWVLDDAHLYDLVFMTCNDYSWSYNEWNTRVLVFLESE